MAEYFRLGRLLLGSYRTGEASDPEVYISGVVRILSAYPLDVVRQVVDPLDGLPSYIGWLPKFSEVKAACERIAGPTSIDRMSDWDRRTQQQLAEREQLAALPAPKQSYADFKAEMAARGMPIDHRSAPPKDAMAVLEKYGITEAQWAAMPNLPKKAVDEWTDRHGDV